VLYEGVAAGGKHTTTRTMEAQQAQTVCSEFTVLQHGRQYIEAVGQEWERLADARKRFASTGRRKGHAPELMHMSKACLAAANQLDTLALAALRKYGKGGVWRRPPLTVEGGIMMVVHTLDLAMGAAEGIPAIICKAFATVAKLSLEECKNEATDLCVAYLMRQTMPEKDGKGVWRLKATCKEALKVGMGAVVVTYALLRTRVERAAKVATMAMDIPGQDLALTLGIRKDKVPIGTVATIKIPAMSAGAQVVPPSMLEVHRRRVVGVSDFSSPPAAWASLAAAVKKPTPTWCLSLGTAEAGHAMSGAPRAAHSLIANLAKSRLWAEFVWAVLMAPGPAAAAERVHSVPQFLSVLIRVARDVATTMCRDLGMGTVTSKCPTCRINSVEACVGWWHVAGTPEAEADVLNGLWRENGCMATFINAMRVATVCTSTSHAILLLPMPPAPPGRPDGWTPPAGCYVALSSVALEAAMVDNPRAVLPGKPEVAGFNLDRMYPLTVVRVVP
jgi:hypothetical protein